MALCSLSEPDHATGATPAEIGSLSEPDHATGATPAEIGSLSGQPPLCSTTNEARVIDPGLVIGPTTVTEGYFTRPLPVFVRRNR